ncbi:PH domain-containing protein [Flavobacterium capsici]|uniref:PH domain-containing protein n=1 Tax=Flavobacterium capsici TaxID=3075618 RepID=A0AA96F2I1_9FLAO|nr:MULTISPECIES: PH domain-containing protein [unclassified Flavobacterium]WNM20060.1 PH domain-containing protein [Flavobacterium sp. PMR2A8]WNM21449.1 PH domain-containing protein [Flavobacterium sp. PMTSA4]
MKIYKSKIDWWLIIPFLIPIYFGIIEVLKHNKSGWLVIVATVAFVVFMYRSTYYIIENNTLTVRSMFIVYEKIEISSIKKIYKTRNPLSSPALSLNRLAIVYNKYDEIMISPEEKVDFMDEILKLNPEISVKS